MGQVLGASLRTETSVSLRIDPMLVLRARLLQLNQFELEQAVEIELMENPALERLDSSEPITDAEVFRSIAPQELQASGDWWEAQRGLPQEGTLNWLDLASAPESLGEHLRAVLLPYLPSRLQSVGEWVIASIDERGYLLAFDEEIALENNCSVEDAAFVVQELQTIAPSGVGARNLRECILLQIEPYAGAIEHYAHEIISNFWDDFTNRKIRKIGRKLNILPTMVEAVYGYVTSLSPHPAAGFGECLDFGNSNRAPAASPDVIFERTETGWTASIYGIKSADLAVDPYYRKKFNEFVAQPAKPASPTAQHERKHILTYVKRANEFIDGVRSRTELLHKVANVLVQLQSGFLSTGSFEFMVPLTRTRLAKAIGAHESTISRATMGKYVQLPNGDVVSFEVFFKPALRIQKMIEEMLHYENPDSPLSDLEISQKLATKGVIVARRTVHKYRDKCRLLSSHRRRIA